MWNRSLGWEDALEKGMTTTSAFLPRKFHRQRSLEGYSPWGCKDSDTTEHEHDVLYSLKGQISAAPFYLDKAKCGYLQRKDWLKIG